MAKTINKALMTIALLVFIVGGLLFSANYLGLTGKGQALSATDSTQPTAQQVGCAFGDNIKLQFSAVDMAVTGTSVGHTAQYSTGNSPYSSATSGTTTLPLGEKVNVLVVNGTTYHNTFLQGIPVDCKGQIKADAKLYKNASITFKVFNDEGNSMTNNGGTTNQSIVSGGIANMVIKIAGEDKASTNDLVVLVEAINGTNTKDVALTGTGAKFIGKNKPQTYTTTGVDSEVWMFEIPAVIGAETKRYDLQVMSESGLDLSGSYINIKLLSKEWFMDDDGAVKYGIENSLSPFVAKSLNREVFKAYFD